MIRDEYLGTQAVLLQDDLSRQQRLEWCTDGDEREMGALELYPALCARSNGRTEVHLVDAHRPTWSIFDTPSLNSPRCRIVVFERRTFCYRDARGSQATVYVYVENDLRPSPVAPAKMIVGFTGTQRGMTVPQRDRLAALLRWWRDRDVGATRLMFAHGDCVGADAQAHVEAHALGYDVVLHPPISNAKRAFCQGAVMERDRQDYLVRNSAIVASADVMVATPGEFIEQLRSGTWSTIRRARKAQKPLVIIFPDGSIKSERTGPA